MNNSSRTLRIALPLGLLAAVLWCLPFAMQGLPMLARLSQNSAQSPTQMPPSGSTLLLNDSTPCRLQPGDSANLVTTIQAGTRLPIVAQYQWWYLVQVNISASKYNRCWINPGATTVEGSVASIPVVTDPDEVALFPAVDTPEVPMPGQGTPSKPMTGEGTPGIPIGGQPTPGALSADQGTPPAPGAPGATTADVAVPGVATTVIAPPPGVATIEVIPGIVVPPTVVPVLTPRILYPVIPTNIIYPIAPTAEIYYPPVLALPTTKFIIHSTDTQPPPIMVWPTEPLIILQPTRIIIRPTEPPVIIEPTEPPVIIRPTDIIIIRPTEPPIIIQPTEPLIIDLPPIIIIKPTP